MKKLHIIILLTLGMCTGTTFGQTVYQATIDQSQANAGAGTGSFASGSATMVLNAAQDQLTYTITLSGLDLDGLQTPDGGDNVTALHFHAAPAGMNGGVVFGMISPNHDTDDLIVDAVAGTLTGIWEETDSNPLSGQLANLMSEGLYINVHTTAFPGGEIRGQVVAAPPIPTLSQWGLIVTALMFLIAGAIAIKKSRFQLMGRDL